MVSVKAIPYKDLVALEMENGPSRTEEEDAGIIKRQIWDGYIRSFMMFESV